MRLVSLAAAAAAAAVASLVAERVAVAVAVVAGAGCIVGEGPGVVDGAHDMLLLTVL